MKSTIEINDFELDIEAKNQCQCFGKKGVSAFILRKLSGLENFGPPEKKHSRRVGILR